MTANGAHAQPSRRYRLEVIQLDGPRRGINMTDIDAADTLAAQWISSGTDAVTIIASGPNDDSFSMRTLRSRDGHITRTAWRTWINTRCVGDRHAPISIDPSP